MSAFYFVIHSLVVCALFVVNFVKSIFRWSAMRPVSPTKAMRQFCCELRRKSCKTIFNQATSLVLIISILTVSTPAATQPLGLGTIVGELSQDIRYSFLSKMDFPILTSANTTEAIVSYGFVLKPILAVVTATKAIFKKKKQERAKVARLEITPNGATIRQGQQIAFAAAAFDVKGVPVQGVPVRFQAIDRQQKTPLVTLKNGLFEPLFSGEFVITAEADGITATTLVRVIKDVESGLQTKRLKDMAQDASEVSGAAKKQRGVLSKEMQELAGQALPAPFNNSSRSLEPVKRESLGGQRALPSEKSQPPAQPFVPMPLDAVRKITDEEVQKMRESQRQQILRRQQLQQQPPPNNDGQRRGGPSAVDDLDNAEMTAEEISTLRRDHKRALSEEKNAVSQDNRTSTDDATPKETSSDTSANSENSENSENSSPARFASIPNGFIDGANAGRYISGWSFDPDMSSNSNMVHIYFDGPAGSGTWGGYIRANKPRPDVNAYFGIAGNHGYEFDVPAFFQDGNWHTVYAYGIDETGDANFQLHNSGMWFNFSGAGNPNWNDGNAPTSDDPGQQPGNPPNQGTDGAGSSNFSFSAPVLSLAGRGDLGVNLSLNYNSLLWHQANGEMTYDIDRGFPAPGWSIGLGKMMDMGVANGAMLEDLDGTRHSYDGTTQGGYTYGYSTYYGHTTDGSMIDYVVSKTPGGISWAMVSLPNGTKITYGATARGAAYPTAIEDRHGNQMTIAYRDNTGPNIDYIVDTQNRSIHFNYDGMNRLVSITGPAQSGGQRVFVRIHYKQISVNGSFSGLTPLLRNANPEVIDAIYYPDLNTGYWFGDNDSYSSYGMIAKVVEQRGMSWSGANNNDQGTITAGMMSRSMTYNYPLTAANLSSAPQYTSMTEDWANRDSGVPLAVTTYNIQNNASPRTTTITLPNGNQIKQSSHNAPGGWHDGLLYQVETISPSSQILSKSYTNWQPGEYGAPRVTEVFSTDEKNQTTKQEFTYTGWFNQVATVKDFGYSNNLLRTKVNTYENGANYVGYYANINGQNVWNWGRHIFSLVKTEELFEAGGTRISRTDYNYDQANLVDAPNVVQYDQASNPYTTQTYQSGEECSQWEYVWVEVDPWNPGWGYYEYQCVQYTPVYSSVYDATTSARGNLTQTISYTDAATPSGAIVYDSTYDITGNLRTTTTNCCQQMSFGYTTNTQYLLPESHTKGSSDPNSPDRMTEYASYDYNTGNLASSTDFNGRTTAYYYDAANRHYITDHPTGARQITHFILNDQYPYIANQTLDSMNGTTQSYSHTYLNGRGQVRFTMQHVPNNPGNFWDGANWNDQQITYDVMGRKASESVVFANATGNPNLWTSYQYDALSRVTQMTAPDGSVSQSFYNEAQKPSSASTTTGQTVRSRDAWGRERWARTDDWGRTVEVVEPDPLGNGSVMAGGDLLTSYAYDAKDQLMLVNQGGQTRWFAYDSLGRLTRQKLAEQTGTINDAGQFVGAGTAQSRWSDAFFYDNRSNLIQRIDARGVKTNYDYTVGGNPDPLNRLRHVTYDKSQADTTYSLPDASPMNLYYMTSGDKTRVQRVETWWTNEVNSYDVEGRISDYTIYFPAGASQTLTTSYLYDTLSRLTEVRYPAQYGMAGAPRKVVNPSYDETSRLKELKVDNQIQMHDIVYNPLSQVTELKTGAGTGNLDIEQYSYDAQTGLLTNQKVIKSNGNQTLMDLSYMYHRGVSNGTVNGKTGQLTVIFNNLDSNKNRIYEYDALGRLKTAKGGALVGLPATASWQQTYSYDRYGNRTNVQSSGVTQNSQAVPTDGLANQTHDQASNRINGYTYDLAGNLVRGQAPDGSWQRYEYDAAGRQVNVYDDNGSYKMGSGYTSSRQRLVKNEAGVGVFWYVWGGDAVIAEYTSAGWGTPLSWAKSYIYAGSRLLSTFTNNGAGGEVLEFHHPDRLGTKLVTNNTANTSFEQSTLPFGTALDAETTGTTNQRFTSYDRSNVAQLDYAVNRSYSSGQGRFTSVDPIGFGASSIGNPQSMNLYAYVGNNPVDFVDPTGLYAACVHQAMTQFLGRLAGLNPKLANKIADFTGDKWEAADSDKHKATNVLNILQSAILGTGPSNDMHFPSQERIDSEVANFPNFLQRAKSNDAIWSDYQRAGFAIHTIQDGLGAHVGYKAPDGHGRAYTAPDYAIGGTNFRRQADAVYYMLQNNPQGSKRLTDNQINDLINAIVAGCGDESKNLKITRPAGYSGIGGGGGIDNIGERSGAGYRDYDPFRSLNWLLFERRYETDVRVLD